MRSMQRTRRLLTLTVLAVILGLSAGCSGGADEVSSNVDAQNDAAPPAGQDELDDESVDGQPDAAATTDEGEPVPIDLDALMASNWTLRFGGGPDGDVPIVDGSPITIMFQGDTISGTAACNSYQGSYAIDGSQLTLRDVSHTEMGCEADIAASEAAYLSALFDVDGINLVGGELALSGMATELIFAAT